MKLSEALATVNEFTLVAASGVLVKWIYDILAAVAEERILSFVYLISLPRVSKLID